MTIRHQTLVPRVRRLEGSVGSIIANDLPQDNEVNSWNHDRVVEFGRVKRLAPVLLLQSACPAKRADSAPRSDLLLVDENFDPAVASPPARCAVIGDRLARPVGDHTNLRRVDAFLAD
jgi:hypothetical protein